MLIGQYPHGRLYTYNGKSIAEFFPSIPYSTGRHAYFELQSLYVYRGDLYAGVYPWGAVWRFDPYSRKWSETRLFQNPKMDGDEISPYEHLAESRFKELREDKNYSMKYPKKWFWNNTWGQRISYLLPFERGIAAVTGNMSGREYYPNMDTFLDKSDRDQYGRIYQLSMSDSICGQINWRDEEMVFECRIDANCIEISQDKKVLASQAIDPLCVDDLKGLTGIVGQGIYGAFNGRMVECQLFLNGNAIPDNSSL